MRRRRAIAIALAVLASCAGASFGRALNDAPPPQLGAGSTRTTAQPNTWSATTTGGRTFMGTWTYAADPATGTVSGTWTLIDAQGQTLARGGWSAAKSPKGWTGGWRANTSGSPVEYAGTWTTTTELPPDAPFADLFKAAIQNVVSGTWRAAGQAGAWSIRAFP